MRALAVVNRQYKRTASQLRRACHALIYSLVQSCRNQRAAERFFCKLLKGQARALF